MHIPRGASEQEVACFLVEAAAWAPSVHNTQPWWFGTRGSTVTVHADFDRRLDVADPDGREMLISCGAALYTLCLAVRCLGHSPQVRMLSDPERPGLIADVMVGSLRPVTEDDLRMYDQIRRRRTHRGGFHPEGLSAGLLRELSTHCHHEGVNFRIVTDPREGAALAALTEAAEQVERQDPRYVAEMARWAPRPGSDRQDGVHDDAYPQEPERTDPYFAARDFARGHGWGLTDDEVYEGVGVIAMFTTATDGRADWLRAGQALQRTLLCATEDGVSAAFHTQALEVPELREFIRTRFCTNAYPQMIVRLGVADREIRSVRRTPAEAMRREP